MVRSFTPAKNSTVNINVSASSQNIFVTNRNSPINVRIMNNGTATVWIAAGGSSVTATTTANAPVGPGVHEVLTFEPDVNGNLYIAAIAAGSTGRIYFTPGDGL
jgi:H+/gluconate symporter-like permease